MAAQGCKGGTCFAAGTQVQVPVEKPARTADATRFASKPVVAGGVTRAIETLKAGDHVFARDDKTGKTVVAKMRATFVRDTDLMITVVLGGAGGRVETLRATEDHPFRVAGKGWVKAGQLAIGNSIVTRAGPPLAVKSVTWERKRAGFTVYNFEVEPLNAKEGDGATTHSYFVGRESSGAWVHNASTYETSPVSMSQAVKREADFVDDNATMITTGRDANNYQFMSHGMNSDGQTVTKIARFDINPADLHVSTSRIGPHMNLEIHVNTRPVSNVHVPITPGSWFSGDHP